MASCGFAHLSGESCESSADNLANVQCVVVGSCAKSTQGHLQNFLYLETAFDCESKNLPRYMNRANLPGRVIVDPSGAFR